MNKADAENCRGTLERQLAKGLFHFPEDLTFLTPRDNLVLCAEAFCLRMMVVTTKTMIKPVTIA